MPKDLDTTGKNYPKVEDRLIKDGDGEKAGKKKKGGGAKNKKKK